MIPISSNLFLRAFENKEHHSTSVYFTAEGNLSALNSQLQLTHDLAKYLFSLSSLDASLLFRHTSEVSNLQILHPPRTEKHAQRQFSPPETQTILWQHLPLPTGSTISLLSLKKVPDVETAPPDEDVSRPTFIPTLVGTAKLSFWWELQVKHLWNEKVGNRAQDCTASNGQSLKACLMYVNTPKISRIFEALGIAKPEWNLTKITLFVVHLVLPISECDGNTARTASAIRVAYCIPRPCSNRNAEVSEAKKACHFVVITLKKTLLQPSCDEGRASNTSGRAKQHSATDREVLAQTWGTAKLKAASTAFFPLPPPKKNFLRLLPLAH